MKFKIGDRVKVINKNALYYGKIGAITDTDFAYDWRVSLGNDDGLYDEDDLELAPKTLDDLEVGDILIDDFNAEQKVLGICGEVYFLSANNFEIYSGGFTLKEIKDSGYKLKEESKTVELTMDEIASKFDIPVEKLKIKKEK